VPSSLSAVASPKPLEVALETPDIRRPTTPEKRFEQGPLITLRGQLFMPEGIGPFPAIVHLHGCAGTVPARDERWTERFVEWGFAVLRIDSLGARGKTSVCDSPADLPVFNRSGDAYVAKVWLARQPQINPERILVAGWSLGGWTVLRALGSPPSDFGATANAKPFRAGIAFYPLCAPPDQHSSADPDPSGRRIR
jgi:dienelactone hydrolase